MAAHPSRNGSDSPDTSHAANADASLTLAVSQMSPDSLSVEINRTIERPQIDAPTLLPTQPPWALEQFFNGEIDLDLELSKRYATLPLAGQMQQRTLGDHRGRKVCTLTTQDGSASLILDADMTTKVVQLSFTLGNMLTLRFTLDALSEIDRTRWLQLMQREEGGLSFLWGKARWESDYLICISRKHHTRLFAFSPHHFDAGIGLTAALTRQLLDWLQEVWTQDAPSADDSAPLLTW